MNDYDMSFEESEALIDEVNQIMQPIVPLTQGLNINPAAFTGAVLPPPITNAQIMHMNYMYNMQQAGANMQQAGANMQQVTAGPQIAIDMYAFQNMVPIAPIMVVSGGIATQQALNDAATDPEGPRTPILIPRTLRVPSPPHKSRKTNSYY